MYLIRFASDNSAQMFDVPLAERSRLQWKGDVPFDEVPWNVGPDRRPIRRRQVDYRRKLFGEHVEFDWSGKSVIDDFAEGQSMEAIAGICQAVGFNTIPAWMRPYTVLSTGREVPGGPGPAAAGVARPDSL